MKYKKIPFLPGMSKRKSDPKSPRINLPFALKPGSTESDALLCPNFSHGIEYASPHRPQPMWIRMYCPS